MANPIPPLGIASRCQGWPFCLSPAGVYSPQTATHWSWTKITSVEQDERTIRINGKPFHKCSSAYNARRFAATLWTLSQASAEGRERQIEARIGESCDPREAGRKVDSFRSLTRGLRIAANVLFLFLFGICPLLVWRFGLASTLWPALLGIYAQTISIALLFSKAHRLIYPQDATQIFKPFLTMLLAAPSAIRAQDILARPLLEEFHPLAVAKALCSEQEFGELASTVMRDLHFPFPTTLPNEFVGARSTEESFQRLLRDSLIRTLDLASKLPRYLAPPAPTESVHAKYCPRCRQQFTKDALSCPDCGGRELLTF